MLFIINFFITFFLLRLTARLTKKEAKTWRLILSSALGGLYSMVILIDVPTFLSIIMKALACGGIILCAFRFYRVKSFLITVLIFLFSNFLFLGIIIGIYLLFKSDLIAVKNGTVYFDIGAKELIFSALIAYIVSALTVRIHNRRLSKGELYMLEIENKGKKVSAFALCDSGNRLREPFSNCGVIVVKSEIVRELFDEKTLRLIPASTVNAGSYLKAFKPDKITVKSADGESVIENAYIALSDEMKSDGFSAVLNPEILSV